MTSRFDLGAGRRRVELAQAWPARLKLLETTGSGTLYSVACGRPNCRGLRLLCLSDYQDYLYLDGWTEQDGAWGRGRGARQRRARWSSHEDNMRSKLQQRPVVIESGGGWRPVDLRAGVLLRCDQGHVSRLHGKMSC